MRLRVLALLAVAMLVAPFAGAAGRATARVSVTIPPLTAVRVASLSASTVSLSLFRTSDVVVVRSIGDAGKSPYELVSFGRIAGTASAEVEAGGWMTIQDTPPVLHRASTRGESNDEVTYEIWSF